MMIASITNIIMVTYYPPRGNIIRFGWGRGRGGGGKERLGGLAGGEGGCMVCGIL